MYKEKYLKYKTKYIALQNKLGGAKKKPEVTPEASASVTTKQAVRQERQERQAGQAGQAGQAEQAEQAEQAVQAEQAGQAVNQAEERNKSLVFTSIKDSIDNGTILDQRTTGLDIDVYWPLYWKIQEEAFYRGFQEYLNHLKTNINEAHQKGYKVARESGYTAYISKFIERCQSAAFLYGFQSYIYYLNRGSQKEDALTEGYIKAREIGYMASRDEFLIQCTRQNEIDIIDRERRITGDYTTPDEVILEQVKNRIRMLKARENIRRR